MGGQPTGRARVLVIDDDQVVTDFLRRGLSYEGFGVEVAQSGRKGLDLARENPPDLVVLDLMMPGMDGLEVCRRLKAGGSVPVLILTAKDAVPDRVAGLETGADDYLVKPFALEELAARIRALLRRQQATAPEALRYADLVLDVGGRRARRGERDISLSTTEFKLLAQLMRHPDQVLTHEVLMDRVWGYDFGGDSNILEVYVRYLRAKLEAGGEPRLIHTVRGSGYALRT
ncbi:MAG: response regulator transcription factor [Chloroflexi bacterium]|nr:response regulator transcription factor [Chloroflexota bacterium]